MGPVMAFATATAFDAVLFQVDFMSDSLVVALAEAESD